MTFDAKHHEQVAKIRAQLADAGTFALPAPDIGEIAIALAGLRGWALGEPDPRASRFVLDRCDVIARLLGMQELLQRAGHQALEGLVDG